MTTEEKSKAYNKAIIKAKALYGQPLVDNTLLETLFPELKESEDEKMKNWILDELRLSYQCAAGDRERCEELLKAIAWLEKQGELVDEYEDRLDRCACESFNKGYKAAIEHQKQKSVDKIEPKFHEGDWITNGQLTCKVLGITGKSYELHLYNDDNCHFETDVQSIDKHYYLWGIKDAKDGDILTSINFHSNCTFIFKGLDNWKFDEPNGDRVVATGYCCLSASADKMEFGIQGPDCVEVNTIKPATKIQRDLLFQKMKEAGYEWDEDKKELRKIENSPILSNSLNIGKDLQVDGFDAELNALLKKYEHLSKKELQEPLEFYLGVVRDDLDIVREDKSKWTEEGIREAQLDYWRSVGGKEWHGVPVQETIAWLKKQTEQKWSEEDEKIIRRIDSLLYAIHESEFEDIHDWLESLKERMKKKTMRFRKGNIITNGKIEYEIRDIQKNQLGDWVYILYNANIARLSSNGAHLPDGSIRWVCEQVDEQFELKQRMEEQK